MGQELRLTASCEGTICVVDYLRKGGKQQKAPQNVSFEGLSVTHTSENLRTPPPRNVCTEYTALYRERQAGTTARAKKRAGSGRWGPASAGYVAAPSADSLSWSVRESVRPVIRRPSRAGGISAPMRGSLRPASLLGRLLAIAPVAPVRGGFRSRAGTPSRPDGEP